MALNALEKPQLPVPSTSLVGRQDELARLTTLLERPDVRLVTLLGPGGVGKTRLAIQFAREIDSGLTGAVYFVLLANARDAGAALTAIARTLGVNQASTIPLEEMIADAIGLDPVLLILDNAEQVAADLIFLTALLGTCPNLRILVTSRVILRLSGEHVFAVDPLPTVSTDERLAPATDLFVERARSVQPDLLLTRENVKAIDDICRQIDGLPLAIELAAARTRFLSPTALRDRLSKRLSHLVGGPRDAPERQRTLRATLTWSHDLLSSDERVLFRRLAVFENGGSYDAVCTVCNASGDLGDDVEEILAALVDHSLVRIVDTPATGPRVRLLNTIRDFAHEQLEVSGELDALRQAHAAWYADLVIRTPPETWRTGTAELRTWTMRSLPDLDNLALALERLVDGTDKVSAIRMVSGLVPFWLELGQLRDGSLWTDRLIAHVDTAPVDVQADFYRVAAIMALTDDTLDIARRHASLALDLALQVGPPRMVANSQNLLGQVYWRMGDATEGERLQRAAIDTVLQTSDPLGGALFAAQIADALIEAGDLDRAEPLLREAMPVVARERPEALPFLQGAMGYLLLQRSDLDGASEHLERSLDYHIQPPHRLPSLLAGRLLTIADLAVRRNAPADAARLLVASLGLCQRIGVTVDQQSREELKRVGMMACAALGTDRLDQEVAAGRALSMPDILGLALAVTRLRSAGEVPDSETGNDLLTPRERDVLALLAEGKSNPDIAGALFISQRTVTTHLSRLYAKLDVSTRSEAIAVATRRGLVTPPAERPTANSLT
ncbi:MAG: LuxR C-terminal-related transcriptional regulator [Chloroflexota bacterium]|nr:LuxR C-terminal-related transcriptional regulator [Chloroflexota bacterium]